MGRWTQGKKIKLVDNVKVIQAEQKPNLLMWIVITGIIASQVAFVIFTLKG